LGNETWLNPGLVKREAISCEGYSLTQNRQLPIGGWLILFVILLASRVWSSGYDSLVGFAVYTNLGYAFGRLPPYDVIPGIKWAGEIEILFSLVWTPLAIFVLKLVLATDVSAPKWVVRLLVLTALGSTIMIVVTVLSMTDRNETWSRTVVTDALEDYAACAIWIPYFLYSKRVKNTFSSKFPRP
jgi:hypothetical protein